MLTALQQSKIDVCLALTDAQRILAECRSRACVGQEVRRELDSMAMCLNQLAELFAPTNDVPLFRVP